MIAADGRTPENAKQTQASCLKLAVSLVVEVRYLRNSYYFVLGPSLTIWANLSQILVAKMTMP